MVRSTKMLHAEIAACTNCAPNLPLGPRPVVQFSRTARILIISQAPGTKVHASGIPWDDQSGARLREWLGISPQDFYNPEKVAIMPMGFCYPGKGKSGDLPPRPECAPLWHDKILAQLPPDHLTLLVGSYAQARYLPPTAPRLQTDRVEAFASFLPAFFPLPHPSWRCVSWMTRNPWFESKLLPILRDTVQKRLD
ncbi:uracil-DNA glycosylase [Janthinobacterium sp. Marseille]|nr:uracil-DNA glycosylase family protein [Janthinobacterium sp. Marseille]ABR91550.1 uracil-DNA glycosylase [Janthinobacterium sp. Marseille]